MATQTAQLRTRVQLEEYQVKNTHTVDFPGAFHGYDDAWSLNSFRKNFKIEIIKVDNEEMEFDMIGIDASIANAYRRIMLSEVPAMAIEKVVIHNNTSIIQDEVLAHRLGLIPIAADPKLFDDFNPGDTPTNKNSITFTLQIKCIRNRSAHSDATDPEELYINSKVTTKDLKLKYNEDQDNAIPNKDIRPVHEDILIAKLRPGQEIDLEMICVKGTGADHAKFSPVATASYRLMPEIILKQAVTGKRAKRLAKCFPEGVIGIKEIKGIKTAYIDKPRLDTCSRQVLRDPELKEHVILNKIRDHFIFCIESTGSIPPADIFRESVKILRQKCHKFLEEVNRNAISDDT
ncbi:DNA-directed RNA polymerases I and III subunit RPAC1 [Trichoplax sp. H2]|nr:DNA-directed RNA polymerases I and III subunit RPAC1 [Trichoplax sp. H2]|eukprot:RDD41117.1 DNA-directed RNA polymerases I and III subunit RPAC1 [Trichoplax sp. H2]